MRDESPPLRTSLKSVAATAIVGVALPYVPVEVLWALGSFAWPDGSHRLQSTLLTIAFFVWLVGSLAGGALLIAGILSLCGSRRPLRPIEMAILAAIGAAIAHHNGHVGLDMLKSFTWPYHR